LTLGPLPHETRRVVSDPEPRQAELTGAPVTLTRAARYVLPGAPLGADNHSAGATVASITVLAECPASHVGCWRSQRAVILWLAKGLSLELGGSR
jgi:hypothetical protein